MGNSGNFIKEKVIYHICDVNFLTEYILALKKDPHIKIHGLQFENQCGRQHDITPSEKDQLKRDGKQTHGILIVSGCLGMLH